jgi:hypothetical protein
MFVLFAELLLATVLFLGGKLADKRKLQNVGTMLLKQGFITLVLFTSFNISFSAGIHFKYGNH